MPAPLPASARGLFLLVVSAVAFSTAGCFVRVAGVDLWAMVFWRNLFGGGTLLLVTLAAGARSAPRSKRMALGRWGWATVAASVAATVCFLASFAFTSVADVAIIYATAPLITALIAWGWRGERATRRTLLGALLALAGVGITLAGSIGGGTLRGDALALAMTVAMSLSTVFARRHAALPTLPTACLASLLAAVLVLPLGAVAGASFAVSWRAVAWLAAFGVTTMAVALPCYFAGVAEVPAAEAMLIGALEMPLAPLWAWLALGERPAPAALIGGAVVAVAIVGQCRLPERNTW